MGNNYRIPSTSFEHAWRFFERIIAQAAPYRGGLSVAFIGQLRENRAVPATRLFGNVSESHGQRLFESTDDARYRDLLRRLIFKAVFERTDVEWPGDIVITLHDVNDREPLRLEHDGRQCVIEFGNRQLTEKGRRVQAHVIRRGRAGAR